MIPDYSWSDSVVQNILKFFLSNVLCSKLVRFLSFFVSYSMIQKPSSCWNCWSMREPTSTAPTTAPGHPYIWLWTRTEAAQMFLLRSSSSSSTTAATFMLSTSENDYRFITSLSRSAGNRASFIMLICMNIKYGEMVYWVLLAFQDHPFNQKYWP